MKYPFFNPMAHYFSLTILLLTSLLTTSCHQQFSRDDQTVLVANNKASSSFADYWYQGEVEINSYAVQQTRYGQMRTGKAVMIFVTEDFSKQKHVKLDEPNQSPLDKISVLKLNHLLRFTTGIYDYSLMRSVFTPVDLNADPNTLKSTTTIQDWCGQSFSQVNLRNNNYRINLHSYFESGGDQEYKVNAVLMEDELFNRIRINPDNIKEGTTDMLPGSYFSHLQHVAQNPRKARIRKVNDGDTVQKLIVEYLHLNRTLIIGYGQRFPHRILFWEESNDGKLTSKGELISSTKNKYWQLTGNDELYLRDSLRLTPYLF